MSRRKSRLVLALAAAAIACVVHTPAPAQTVRLFTDWQAACDNLRACSVLGMAPAEIEGFGFIELRRDGAANAELRVSIAFTFETESQELPLEISFDPPGPDNVFPRDAVARIGRDSLLRLDLPPENASAFIVAVRRAETLTVRRLDDPPKEQESTSISLRGAVAALRWMDEQQMRAGNVTALVARGDRPASAMPAQPSLPAVTRAPWQVREIEGKAPRDVSELRKADCPDLPQDSEGEEIGYQLTADIVLWQMPCARGAYSFSNVYYTRRRGAAPAPVLFPQPVNGKLAPTLRHIVDGEFAEDDRSIFFFAKGRGIGDCGARGSYVWDGRAFALTGWQEMPTCRGAPLDLWPVLWRAEVRGR